MIQKKTDQTAPWSNLFLHGTCQDMHDRAKTSAEQRYSKILYYSVY